MDSGWPGTMATKWRGLAARQRAAVFLVAAVPFLLAAATGRGRGARQGEPADLLVVGANIPALEAGVPPSAALAVRNGRIVALGTEADVRRSAGPGSRIVDAGGATVVPSFVDHHVHLLNVGFALLNTREKQRLYLDLSDARSVEEIARRVRERADSLPAGAWVLGKEWNQAAWGEGALPDRAALDRAAPDHPVFLARSDGHAGWANGVALRMAGIDASTPDPPGGKIVRRPDGTPTGILLERANEAVVALIPPPSDADVREAFRLAAEAMAERGVSRVYDAGFLAFPGIVALNADLGRYLRLLVETDSARPLPIDVNLMIPAPSRLADSVVAHPDRYVRLSPRLGVTALKLFADGALGSRGAALIHPYADDPTTRGVPRMTEEEILEQTRRALDAGLDIATHAIGDEAVRRVLDAYERILKERPQLEPRRLRIEHFSFAREEDFARAVRLGVLLSVQPDFNTPKGDLPTFGDVRVGHAADPRVYAWRRLDSMGAPLAGGTDYFTAPGPALLTFEASLTWHNAIGTTGPGPGGRLESFRQLTVWFPPGGGAPSSGRLQVGGAADLSILSRDPLTAPDSDLVDIRVLATLRRGRVVYSDSTLAGLR
ncbi:MAG: amidohydrolase [Gemmatimonadetes bacterium]|nr:amidohydrolase [Gemmatimonadota bacterium]